MALAMDRHVVDRVSRNTRRALRGFPKESYAVKTLGEDLAKANLQLPEPL